MKICPFCADEIKDAAVKCKHCGETVPKRPVDQDTFLEAYSNFQLAESVLDRIQINIATYGANDAEGAEPVNVEIGLKYVDKAIRLSAEVPPNIYI